MLKRSFDHLQNAINRLLMINGSEVMERSLKVVKNVCLPHLQNAINLLLIINGSEVMEESLKVVKTFVCLTYKMLSTAF